MAEMPDPGALGDTDVAVVSMVRKVKSKLGYTEINTPVDLSQFDDEKVWSQFISAIAWGEKMTAIIIKQQFGFPINTT